MANLMDLCEALADEGRSAQLYEEFEKEVKDKEGKDKMKELQRLSIEKMKILHAMVAKAPWVLESKGTGKKR